jgi:hypothetical protein
MACVIGGLNRRVAVALAFLVALVLSGAAAPVAGATGTLTVSVQGPGRVMAPGIDCGDGGTDCSQMYVSERICEPPEGGGKPICYLEHPFVSASAQPRPGSGFAFQRWDGCPAGNDGGPACRLVMTQSHNLTVYFIDDTAPSVALLEPARDVARAQVRLQATTSDNVGVTRVDYYVRGAPVGTASPSEGVMFNTAQVGDGPAVVKAVAVDASGRSGQGERTMIFDNTPAALAVAGAADGAFAPGTALHWTISAADAVGLASVECSLEPKGSSATFGPCSGGKGSHAATLRVVGDYAFTVRAEDTAGNVTMSRPLQFRIDPRGATSVSGAAVGSGADSGGLGGFQPLVRYSFRTRGRWTQFLSLRVSGLPRGSRAEIACKDRGCPVRRKRFAPRNGRVSLVGALKGRRLRAGARLTVSVVGPAGDRKVVTFRMRRGKVPRKVVRCMPPGGRLGRCR